MENTVTKCQQFACKLDILTEKSESERKEYLKKSGLKQRKIIYAAREQRRC